MSIIVNVDVMMAKRKMSSQELAEKIGITAANLSILKTGKAKAVRFSTLEAICQALDCQPETSSSTEQTRKNSLSNHKHNLIKPRITRIILSSRA